MHALRAETETACNAREHVAGRETRGIRRQANTKSIPHTDALRKYTKTQRRVIWWILARLRRHGPSQEWRTHVSASQEVIAAQIGIDRRSVLRALARLQADGLVTRRHQPLPTGGRLADLIVADRSALAALAGGKCHIRTSPKCHIRSTSLVVNRSCCELSSTTGTDLAEGEPMQGELFVGKGRGKSKDKPDNARTRLDDYQARYRAKYGRAAVIPNRGIVLALVKRWQEHFPTRTAWLALIDAYLRQNDRAVVEAGHPITWLSRRLPALLPVVHKEVEAEARRAKVAEKNTAIADTMTPLQRLRLKHPGINEGESVEAWQVRIKAARARRRAEEQAARKWA